MSKETYITTTKGVSGHFAVMLAWHELEQMWEPIETGFGRYETRDEAEIEAQDWADAEEVQFRINEVECEA